MGKALVLTGTDFSLNKLTTVVIGDVIPCTALSFDINVMSFDNLSETKTITATKTPSNTTDGISWVSSNTSVATVANGVVTPKGAGSATITATCGQQTATCSVSISLDPEYVLVAGFNVSRASAGGNFAYVEKMSAATNNQHLLAADSSDENTYPLTYDSSLDTTPYRFVPIIMPEGKTKIRITSDYTMFGRIAWFKSTEHETYKNYGAKLIDGITQSGGYNGWDQESLSNTIEYTKPSGADSFAVTLYLYQSGTEKGTNVPDAITIAYLSE